MGVCGCVCVCVCVRERDRERLSHRERETGEERVWVEETRESERQE